MSNIVVLGYGEVGQAVAKMYLNDQVVQIHDPDKGYQEFIYAPVDILNVCIPFQTRSLTGPNFVETIIRDIDLFHVKLTIIHSTVEPGTTGEIQSRIKKGRYVVHSPVRGVHPNLYKSLKTFIKYIGGDSQKAVGLADAHLSALGYPTRAFNSSKVTEVGKLLSTSYYGVLIAWHGEMQKMCDELNIPFEQAVTDFNETYNEGYTKMGREDVVRPSLYPPDSGRIFGHCITQNAELLKSNLKENTEALDLILKYKVKKED